MNPIGITKKILQSILVLAMPNVGNMFFTSKLEKHISSLQIKE
jgi:hypothetical protein